jgi:hypothetical protein
MLSPWGVMPTSMLFTIASLIVEITDTVVDPSLLT